MNAADWLWSLAGLATVGILGFSLMAGLDRLLGSVDPHPSFMSMQPLGPGRYWILAAWLPCWVLNIMGEEILWHGVILPRQAAAIGPRAWLFNGAGWLLFHLAFGWQLVIPLLPALFIIPYLVQRRRNSWIGVVIHAAINGPGFLVVAFGLV